MTGDIITKLGNCDVHNFDSWIGCLNHIKTSVDSGFCLSPEFVQHHDETKPGKHKIMIFKMFIFH